MSTWKMGKPFTVTEEHLKSPWFGGRGGVWFRCFFCGYKFVAGDEAQLDMGTGKWVDEFGHERGTSNVLSCGVCRDKCAEVDISVADQWAIEWAHVQRQHWYFVRPGDPPSVWSSMTERPNE